MLMIRKIVEIINFEIVCKCFVEKGDEEVKDFVKEIVFKVKKVFKIVEVEFSGGYVGIFVVNRVKVVVIKVVDGVVVK